MSPATTGVPLLSQKAQKKIEQEKAQKELAKKQQVKDSSNPFWDLVEDEPVAAQTAKVVQQQWEPSSDSGSDSEGWTTIKEKKRRAPRPVVQDDDQPSQKFGGKKSSGHLAAGPIQQLKQKYPNATTAAPRHEVVHHASTVADYDFGYERDQQQRQSSKFETYSKKCAQAVSEARLKANLGQSQLATKINEKTSVIVELENATGRYSADVINRIEKVLRV
jgi:hypothetical protein